MEGMMMDEMMEENNDAEMEAIKTEKMEEM